MTKLTEHSVYPVGIFIFVALVAGGLLIGASSLLNQRSDETRRLQAQELAEQIARENTNKDRDTQSETSNEAPGKDEKEDKPVTNHTSETPAELPETGAADDLARLMVISLLTVSISMYIGSRKKLLS